jgi:hypothetical protein
MTYVQDRRVGDYMKLIWWLVTWWDYRKVAGCNRRAALFVFLWRTVAYITCSWTSHDHFPPHNTPSPRTNPLQLTPPTYCTVPSALTYKKSAAFLCCALHIAHVSQHTTNLLVALCNEARVCFLEQENNLEIIFKWGWWFNWRRPVFELGAVHANFFVEEKGTGTGVSTSTSLFLCQCYYISAPYLPSS